MKKMFLFIFSLITLISASGAQAISIRPYIGADVGTSTINTKGTNWGSVVSIAGGVVLPTPKINMRAALEFSYLNIDGDSFQSGPDVTSESKHEIQTEKYLVNFYIDMLQSYALKPYVGVGFGYIHFNENRSYTRVNMIDGTLVANIHSSTLDDALTYGVLVGAGFEMTHDLFGDIGVKFFEARLDHSDKHMFSLNVGLRYIF